MINKTDMLTIESIKHEIPTACQKYRIKTVDLFGSIARDEATENSDIDMLIELEAPITEKSASRFFGFLHFVEDTFGRKVDLLTTRSIKNPYLKQAIDQEKIRIYG